jgi:hypothetical protein
MSLTNQEIYAKLMKPVGKAVAFKYPGSNLHGELRERVIVPSEPFDGADYWDVIDLIEFPQQKNRYWMRIGYYRQVGDKIRWASQTAITEPIHIMKRVLKEANKKMKDWGRPGN